MQSGRSTTQKRLLSQRSYRASSSPSPDGSGALNVQGRAKSIASQLRRSAEDIPALPFPSRSHATSPMMTATDDTPRSSHWATPKSAGIGGERIWLRIEADWATLAARPGIHWPVNAESKTTGRRASLRIQRLSPRRPPHRTRLLFPLAQVRGQHKRECGVRMLPDK
jgi:hypothetical protein